MQDKWMNIGYDDDCLKPYCEPTFADNEESRLRMFHREILTDELS